jgi:hypothetical protein
MWILNKQTGCRFDISNEELIDRLLADDNYEEIELKEVLIAEAKAKGIKVDKRMSVETILKKLGGE